MGETVFLCAADEVVEVEIKQAPLPDGTKVALYRVDGSIYATADMCTHGEASLSEEGIITGNTVLISARLAAANARSAPHANPNLTA